MKRAAVLGITIAAIVCGAMFWHGEDGAETGSRSSASASLGFHDASRAEHRSSADWVASTSRQPALPIPQQSAAPSEGAEEPPKFGALVAMSLAEASSANVDATRVGQPFEISAVVKPECPQEDGSNDCDDQQRLDQFTSEPRDAGWADHAEERLRDMVTKRNSGFSIRNLECRLVTCIIEVESRQGSLRPSQALLPVDWRAVKVAPHGSRAGVESHSLDEEVTATLWIYERLR